MSPRRFFLALRQPHQPMTAPDDLYRVGHVLDAWGVRGWVKVAPDDPQAAALLKAKTWWLSRPGFDASPRPVQVRLARRHGGALVALFEGPEDRSGAEALRGNQIAVRRADFPPAQTDEFYWADLIGCRVLTPQGEDLGTVIGLLDSAAHAILRVQFPGDSPDAKPRERLIPFVQVYIDAVDLPGKTIVAQWNASYD